jgi:hypothetical protein
MRRRVVRVKLYEYKYWQVTEMMTGARTIDRSSSEVLDRLKLAMSAGNFEITAITDCSISFRHGTYLTQSAPLLPKRGTIRIASRDHATDVSYEIEPTGFPKYWLIFVAIVFCWVIFPPILVYRALVHHPRQLMENLLQGI